MGLAYPLRLTAHLQVFPQIVVLAGTAAKPVHTRVHILPPAESGARPLDSW